MSYSQLFYAGTEGQMKSGKVFRNSWLLCPFVWTTLSERYGLGSSMRSWTALWDKIRDKEIIPTPVELNVVHFTYDCAYVEGAQDIQRLISSLRLFVKAGDGANCLTEVADEIQRLVEAEPTLQYIGLYGTSIAENYWALRSLAEDGASCLHSFAGNPENFVREINDDESPHRWFMYEV